MLAYQPDTADLLYLSAAKGYRPGGINGPLSSICGSNLASIGLTSGPEIYAADSLWSYEVGVKSSLWDGRMQINASGFVIDWNNIQQAVYLPACGQNFVENLGKVRSVGGEVEMQARPVEALLFDVSAAHVDAKYTHTVCAGRAPAQGSMRRRSRSSAGDRLPGAPWTFLTSAEYDFPAIASRKPYLRVDFQYTTAQTALQPIQDPNNGVSDPTYTGLPETKNLSLRAGLRFGGIDLSLFAQNLTDSQPVLSHTRDTTTSELFFDHTVRPRSIGITATYRHGRRTLPIFDRRGDEMRPADLGYSMPAEWAPHAGCWMAWPKRIELWQQYLETAREDYIRVARAIARFEPLTMIADPEHATEARMRCGPSINVLPLSIDDSWLRDSAPTVVVDPAGRRAAAAFTFNAWGGKYRPHDQDAALGERLAAAAGIRELSIQPRRGGRRILHGRRGHPHHRGNLRAESQPKSRLDQGAGRSGVTRDARRTAR